MEDNNIEINYPKQTKLFSFDNISLWILFILAFLIPIFFIPSSLSLGSFDKPALIIFGTLLIAIFWVIARLKDGRFSIQKNFISLASVIMLITLLISAVASPFKDFSFFGFGYETGTFFFVFLSILLMFFTSYLMNEKSKINKLFSAILISSGILFILQLINVFTNLKFAGLQADNQTLFGSFGNLALFFGLVAVIACIRLSEEKKSKAKLYLTILFIATLIALCVVNFTLAWILILATTVLYAIYRLVKRRSYLKNIAGSDGVVNFAPKHLLHVITWPIILLFVLSLLFIILGRDGVIGSGGGPLNKVSESIVQSPLEVRPSASATFMVSKSQISERPLWGAGLNRFSDVWQQYKPDAIIQNPYFWNTEFAFGHSYLATFLSTAGILGAIGILLFLLSILWMVLKGIIKSFSDEAGQGKINLIITSLATLYLWVITLLYVPSPALLALTFIVTGVHLALLKEAGLIKSFDFSKIKPQAYGFVSTLAFVVFGILVLACGFSYTQKAMAWSDFGHGVNKVVAGDIDGGLALLIKATNLDRRDLYFRIKSEAELLKLSKIVNQEGKTQDELRHEFESVSGQAYADAVSAIELNPNYYANYLGLAKVYTSLIPYGVKDASVAAINTYDKVATIAPKNPIIPYQKANLYFGLNDRKNGEASLEKAIVLKSNYTDALFLRSQLAIKDGKLDKALTDTYAAVSINPTNTGLLFQLGFLQYRSGDYKNAVVALANAVNINPSYSNARYFLGLALDKIGKRADAIEQFKIVLQLNPDNQGVKDIITNLTAGRDPFTGVQSEALPDKKDVPPINEDK